jgi:hypothetical protein
MGQVEAQRLRVESWVVAREVRAGTEKGTPFSVMSTQQRMVLV